MKSFLTALALLVLAGCGIADHYTAQSRMDDAERDYRACLNQHLSRPAACDALRQVWDADKVAYDSGSH